MHADETHNGGPGGVDDGKEGIDDMKREANKQTIKKYTGEAKKLIERLPQPIKEMGK